MAIHVMRPGPVYPILDTLSIAKRGMDPRELLAMWRDLRVRWVQIRDKSSTDEQILASARTWKAEFPSIEFILNDRWELATANPETFAGLHLGQEDLEALDSDAKARIARSGLILGHSTHKWEETTRAAEGLDLPWSYIAVGPCFPTSSKPGGKDPVLSVNQIVQLTEVVLRSPGRIVVWIGGIDRARVSELRQILAPKGLWTKERGVVSLISGAMDRPSLASIMAECELTDTASPSHGT